MGGRFATGIDHDSPNTKSTTIAARNVGTKWSSTQANVIPARPTSDIRRRPNRAPSQPAGIDPMSVDTATAMKPSDASPTVTWNRSEPWRVNQLENDWNAMW